MSSAGVLLGIGCRIQRSDEGVLLGQFFGGDHFPQRLRLLRNTYLVRQSDSLFAEVRGGCPCMTPSLPVCSIQERFDPGL